MRWRNRILNLALSGILISNFSGPLSLYAKELNSMDSKDSMIEKEIIPISKYHRPATKMKPEYITIHNTANNSEGADADMHSVYLTYNQDTYVSWHFTVDDKKVIEHLPIDEVGYHAGDEEGKGNSKSIGIEICENADGNYAKAEQNAIPLVVELLLETGLTPDKVVPHQHWTGKNCPQNMLEKTDGSMGWEAFIQSIEKEYTKHVQKKQLESVNQEIENSHTKIHLKKGKTAVLGLYATESSEREFVSNEETIHLRFNKKDRFSFFTEKAPSMELITVGMDTESKKQKFEELWLDKKVKKTESELLSENGSIKKEGVEKIELVDEGNTYTFLIHTYAKYAPTILTNTQVFLSFGIPSTLLQSSSLKGEWIVENPDIVEIKEGVITGKKEGETKISTVIEGKMFTQTVIVEVK